MEIKSTFKVKQQFLKRQSMTVSDFSQVQIVPLVVFNL